MGEPKFRVAIVGATGTALKRTIPALQASSTCEVAAVQGRNQDRLAGLSEQFHIPHCYADVREMLDAEDCDLVFIATPPFLHLDAVTQSVSRQKPTICEKPLGRDYHETEQIAGLLARYPRVPFMVAHHLRHQKAFQDIRRILASGQLGRLVHTWFQWGFRMNLDAPNAAWKMDPALGGGGTFTDNGVHVVDLAIALFGPPKDVAGYCTRERLPSTYDTETALLRYGGASVVLNSSQSMAAAGNHLLIYGASGSIEAFGAIGEQSIRQVRVSGPDGQRTISYESENLYRNEIEDFCAHYLAGDANAEPGTSVGEALTSMKVIELLRRSSQVGAYQTMGG